MDLDPIKILLVDDSVLYHAILGGILAESPGYKVVGTAKNGQIALEKMHETNPDVILLDMEMPVMDGLSTLHAIHKERPQVGVIMISGVNKDSADTTIKALENGALGFIAKPHSANTAANRETLKKNLTELLDVFVERRVVKSPGVTTQPRPVPVTTDARAIGKIDLVAIGVSTGGPNALAELIPRLPADLGVPILIVQHMPPVFTRSLAESLARKSALAVREAEEEEIRSNVVYIAPGGRHMVIRSKNGMPTLRIGLTDAPPELNCKPSVNVLFRSLATTFNGNVLAIVMTGMGNDGCDGVRALKRRGCMCLAQDEKSSTVYGMPRAVIDAGLVDEVAPLNVIAERIIRVVKNTGRNPP